MELTWASAGWTGMQYIRSSPRQSADACWYRWTLHNVCGPGIARDEPRPAFTAGSYILVVCILPCQDQMACLPVLQLQDHFFLFWCGSLQSHSHSHQYGANSMHLQFQCVSCDSQRATAFALC